MMNVLEPTIEELRMLVAFVDANQAVTAAAQSLGIEQYTASRRLAVFKKTGGDSQAILETRDGHLRLTPNGQAALPAVRDVVRQYERLVSFLGGADDEPQVVRVGVGNFALQHYLPRLLAELAKSGSGLKVEPRMARGQDRIVAVARGEFDMGIVTHHTSQIASILAAHLPGKTELTVEPLARQPFCVAARRNTPLGDAIESVAPPHCVRLTDLASWPLVGLDRQSGIRQLIEQNLNGKKPLRFVPGTGTGGWPAAKEFARQGLGVAILPLAELHGDDYRELAIRRLSERLSFQDYLIHRPQPLSTAQERLKQGLRRAAREHQSVLQRRSSSAAGCSSRGTN